MMDSKQAVFYHEHVLIKEPGNNNPSPWHHDQPYYPVDGSHMCSIWMHTENMPVEAATKFFMENAFQGELPARREAMRGTFDPGYLNYTLGKLMILKLREDYRKEVGAAFSLREFHDRLLAYGAPALPLVRDAMLANPGGSPL